MQTKHLCVLIHIWTTEEVSAPWNRFLPSRKNIFTDRSKAVLLLWIICLFYVLCLPRIRVCSLLPCSHLKGKDWPFGSCLWCLLWFVTFPFGILGQVWYLIVSIPDPCCLSYFVNFISCHVLMYTQKNNWRIFRFRCIFKVHYNKN